MKRHRPSEYETVMDEPVIPVPPLDTASDRHFFYPNKMGRIILLAMEEVMGRNGVNAILNLAQLKSLVNNYPPNDFDRQFAFEEVGAIQQAVDDMYGPRGARGLALRAGRACFKYSIKESARSWALPIWPSGYCRWA